jgi:cysteine synthase
MEKTPLIELEQDVINDVTIYGKLEGENPTGSIKDRFAHHILNQAETSGELKQGMTIIEMSAGSSALALANVAKEKGNKSEFYLPSFADPEIIDKIRSLGGVVHLVSLEDGPFAPIDLINEKCARGTYFWPQQYFNPDGPLSYVPVAEEIEEQLSGNGIDFLVAGVGTGGTLLGVGRKLKESNPDLRTIAFFASSMQESIPGIRPLGIELSYKNHEELYNANFPTHTVGVTKSLAQEGVGILERNNISCGLSSGAALHSLLHVLPSLDEKRVGSYTAVVILADGYRSGEKDE